VFQTLFPLARIPRPSIVENARVKTGGAARQRGFFLGRIFRSALPLIGAAVLVAPGCSTYHRFQPTVVQQAGIATGGDMSDASVLSYADGTRDVLRQRFHIARNVRQTSTTGQILLAGGAGMAAAFKASATAVATLAAASAGVPQIADVFDTGGRAIAYQQAVEKISQAESAYFKARAGAQPVVPQNQLTIEGALLLEAVNGATDAVELFQAGMLPTIESLRRAEATELHRRASVNEARGGRGFVAERPRPRPAPARPVVVVKPVVVKPVVVKPIPTPDPVVEPQKPEPTQPDPLPFKPDPAKPDPTRPEPIKPEPAKPEPSVFEEQVMRVSLGGRVNGLPSGRAAQILKDFGRATVPSDTSNRQRLKTFVTEADAETLRKLDKAIP